MRSIGTIKTASWTLWPLVLHGEYVRPEQLRMEGTMTFLELTSSGTADFNVGDVYFIGNATTLIRFCGLTILTDPAFLHKGEQVDLGHGIWARREVERACQVADLPPTDLVIVSHYHGDHFDDVAAQELGQKLPVVSAADAVGKLSSGLRAGLSPRHLGI